MEKNKCLGSRCACWVAAGGVYRCGKSRKGAGLKVDWKINGNVAKMRLILHSISRATQMEGYENEQNKTISRPKLSD